MLEKKYFQKFISLLILFFIFFIFPGEIKAEDPHNCLELNDSFSLNANPTEIDISDPVTFDVGNGLAGDCENKYVILCIDITSDGSQYYCGSDYAIFLDSDCTASPFIYNSGFTTNGIHTAALINGYSSSNSICSNVVSFEVTGGVTPSNCVTLGESCCINELGQCLDPGNSCCNICPATNPSDVWYCNALGIVDNTQSCGQIGQDCCSTGIKCYAGEPDDSNTGSCTCIPVPPPSNAMPMHCNGTNGIDSAIGCIPINDTRLMLEFWFRWGIGLASGFSFLLIIYSAFLIMTSTGDPKRIQAGRELLFSAIAGLIFLVFAVFILRLIGVDILHIPGWGV